jgi:hypothetical protein
LQNYSIRNLKTDSRIGNRSQFTVIGSRLKKNRRFINIAQVEINIQNASIVA